MTNLEQNIKRLEDLKGEEGVDNFLAFEELRVKAKTEIQKLEETSADVKNYLSLLKIEGALQKKMRQLAYLIPADVFSSPFAENKKVHYFSVDKEKSEAKILSLGGTEEDIKETIVEKISYFWKFKEEKKATRSQRFKDRERIKEELEKIIDKEN